MHEVGAGATRPPVTAPPGKREGLAQASARVPFRLKVAVVWVAIFILLGVLFNAADFNTQWMRDHAWYIVKGLQFTIMIAVASIILAVVLALVGALGRLSHNPIAFGVSGFYTSFFRGTPLIVQMFLITFALPQVVGNLGLPSNIESLFTLDPFVAGIIALGLNYGAYMTEIFRAGIQSVGHGQGEAADALGMTYGQKMKRVVLPQAFRVIIPPTGNEFIAMMKDTALVSFLGVVVTQAEVFRRADLAGKADFQPLEALLLAAGLYWALTAVFTFFQSRLERRISKGYVRGSSGGKRTKIVSTSRGDGGTPAVFEEVAGPEPGGQEH
jgi:polar amino acid transport system permease protein